jgi:predicted fused transcriptional regulator/phosphomethylpyrimidine kinase
MNKNKRDKTTAVPEISANVSELIKNANSDKPSIITVQNA